MNVVGVARLAVVSADGTFPDRRLSECVCLLFLNVLLKFLIRGVRYNIAIDFFIESITLSIILVQHGVIIF